jgi:hypothetical protein
MFDGRLKLILGVMGYSAGVSGYINVRSAVLQ